MISNRDEQNKKMTQLWSIQTLSKTRRYNNFTPDLTTLFRIPVQAHTLSVPIQLRITDLPYVPPHQIVVY